MEIKLLESENELLGVLKLQEENYVKNIPSEQKESNGFVTVKHDLSLLKKMNHAAKQIIAIEKGEVIAYALVMQKELRDAIPVLVPMFDMLEQIEYQGKKLSEHSFYVMGQICIARTHRGSGLFGSLYNKHREVYSTDFSLCITEVSSSNLRSMKAHEKVGFQTIHTFSDTTDEWNILVWDWKDKSS